jgi:type IV pilus assembly protein PilM
MPIIQTAAISVDIGHSNLKIVQTSADGRIIKFAVHKMPEGCIDDLTIVYEDALVQSLRKARKLAKLGSGKCSLVVTGNDIIIRHFTLPMLNDEQLYQNVLHEIAGYLPVEPDKYFIDYKITGTTEEEGIKMYTVLVACVHQRILGKYKKTFKTAGLTLNVVDTCENACEKLLRLYQQRNKDFSLDGGICMLDFGKRNTHVSLYDNGRFYASNLLKRSSQSITDAIAKATGRDVLSSEQLKREADYLNAPHKNADLKAAVVYEVDALLQEINRVLDYYRNRTKRPIRAIYISGGGALLPGLGTYMRQHLSIPVYPAAGLIPAGSADNPGFAFLLNAYAATLREEMP